MTYIRFGIRYLRDVGIVYYDRMEKQTPEGTTLYGVRVTLHGAGEEQTASCFVTESREQIDRLLDTPRRNAVTPCTLEEVIDTQVF